VLPRLTAGDLTALGITSVGHRRKLLDAIAALDQGRAAAAAEPSAAVCRFEGHLARFLGDGVLAYFGWPRAHEDDAERAVRAGLQLVEEIARLKPGAGVRLQARVGVATGHVVVGDLISEGISDRDAISGDTPNLAARLQAVAAPASVVISQSTRRLVSGLFELTDLGPQRLKGFAEPLSAWHVEGQDRAEGRFEARQTGALTPLVGHAERRLPCCCAGGSRPRTAGGQVVLLSGEPADFDRTAASLPFANRLPQPTLKACRKSSAGERAASHQGVTWVTACDRRHCAQPQGVASYCRRARAPPPLRAARSCFD
jgi:class 3 adenylate cyclase